MRSDLFGYGKGENSITGNIVCDDMAEPPFPLVGFKGENALCQQRYAFNCEKQKL